MRAESYSRASWKIFGRILRLGCHEFQMVCLNFHCCCLTQILTLLKLALYSFGAHLLAALRYILLYCSTFYITCVACIFTASLKTVIQLCEIFSYYDCSFAALPLNILFKFSTCASHMLMEEFKFSTCASHMLMEEFSPFKSSFLT